VISSLLVLLAHHGRAKLFDNFWTQLLDEGLYLSLLVLLGESVLRDQEALDVDSDC
jgi:hypothetical protein